MQKILVTVKRVIDPYVKIRVKQDHSGVETQSMKMAMNPFDEIGVEAAVQLKETMAPDVEIVAVTIGDESVQETIRSALDLGADRGLHLQATGSLSPLQIATLLQQVVLSEKPDLVLMGKQAIDNDNNQTGQMLAGLLGWPQATFASKLAINGKTVQVEREIDGGLETLELILPAVITTDLRLNKPRYASLPNIMKAKQKPLEIKPVQLDDLPRSRITTLKVTPPPQRSRGIQVETAAELVAKLVAEKDLWS